MKIAMFDNPDGTAQSGNWFARARRFLIEVRGELGRVTWPSRREVWATTIVVILVSLVFGIYLFTIDIGLDRSVRWIFQQFGG